MSGIHEILLIAAIGVVLIMLPRVRQAPPSRPVVVRGGLPQRLSAALGVRLRLAVVASVLWPLAWAAYLQPWRQDLLRFVCLGLAPVVVGWSIVWIVAGTKRPRR